MTKLKYKDKLKKLQSEKNKEIIQLRKKGLTLEQIGDRFGISKQAVGKIIKQNSEVVNQVDKK